MLDAYHQEGPEIETFRVEIVIYLTLKYSPLIFIYIFIYIRYIYIHKYTFAAYATLGASPCEIRP
jgi:hypothetical protein